MQHTTSKIYGKILVSSEEGYILTTTVLEAALLVCSPDDSGGYNLTLPTFRKLLLPSEEAVLRSNRTALVTL